MSKPKIPTADEVRAAWETYCRAAVALRDAKRMLAYGFDAATEDCADVIGRAQGRVRGEAKREDEIGRWADSTIDLYIPGGPLHLYIPGGPLHQDGRTAEAALEAGRLLFARKAKARK